MPKKRKGMPRAMRLEAMSSEPRKKRAKTKITESKKVRGLPKGVRENALPMKFAKAHGRPHGVKVSDKKLEAPTKRKIPKKKRG